MKHSSWSIFNILESIQGVVLWQCKPTQAVLAVRLSLAAHRACTGMMAKAVMGKKLAQRSNLAKNCISSLGNHTGTNVQEKAEVWNQQQSTVLAFMDFRFCFQGVYWGDCLLPLCLFSCLHHAKCLRRHAVDLKKKPNKTKHKKTTPKTQNTLKCKNNTQKQNWKQLPQLGQGTDLIYCAQIADLAACNNGNSSWALLVNVNFECLQTSLIF